MKAKLNQDEIIDSMGAENMEQVVQEFSGKTLAEITNELNEMYTQDDNTELATAIYAELN